MTLVHEFSHTHDYIKRPMDKFASDYSFETETRAYDYEARYALEMDRKTRYGIYEPGSYTKYSGFSGGILKNYGDSNYKRVRDYLAANSAHY